MELKDFVKATARILGISESKVQAYADKAGEDVDTDIEELVEASRTNLTKKFDEGHKKATALTTKTVAEAISTALDLEITAKTPEELAAALKTELESKGGDGLTEDAVKNSEAYKTLQADLLRSQQDGNKEVEKRVKAALKEKEAEFKKEIRTAKRSAIDTKLEKQAEEYLTEKGAILNADPAKRKLQIKEFVKKLNDYDVEGDEDGEFVFSKDNKPKTNADGHNAKLTDLFEENDWMFSYQDVQNRQSTGLPPNQQRPPAGGFKHYKGEVPKSEAEMDTLRMKFAGKEIGRDAYLEVKEAYEAATTK